MSSTALYKAFIEVGASEDSATRAAEDVIQVSQLEQLTTKADLMATKSELMAKIDLMATKSDLVATKSELAATRADIARLEINMANLEARLVKWMVGSLFVFASIIIALG